MGTPTVPASPPRAQPEPKVEMLLRERAVAEVRTKVKFPKGEAHIIDYIVRVTHSGGSVQDVAVSPDSFTQKPAQALVPWPPR
jgi:hypothetical protein